MKISDCGGIDNAVINISNCANVNLCHIETQEDTNHSIYGLNLLGESCISFIKSNKLYIQYNDTQVEKKKCHTLIIQHYHQSTSRDDKLIYIYMFQKYYKVEVEIYKANISNVNGILQGVFYSENYLLVNDCHFTNNSSPNTLFFMSVKYTLTAYNNSLVHFNNCHFSYYQNTALIKIQNYIAVVISNCKIHNNHNVKAYEHLYSSVSVIHVFNYMLTSVTITNSSFYRNTGRKYFLKFEYNQLKLIGPIEFYNISEFDVVVSLSKSTIQCNSGYIEFSYINAKLIFDYYSKESFYMFISSNTIINITQNQYEKFAIVAHEDRYTYSYPFCYFQYVHDDQINHNNYLIIFKNNNEQSKIFAYNNLPITHCKWLEQSVFGRDVQPLGVNKQYIQYTSDGIVYDILPYSIKEKTLCPCDEKHHDCHQDNLGMLYPGQTLVLLWSLNPNELIGGADVVTAKVFYENNIDNIPSSACVVTNSSQKVQYLSSNICVKMMYTIAFPEEGWCELFIRSDFNSKSHLDIYYINQIPCPLGFVKTNGSCGFFSSLHNYGITCDINDQTILRPHHSWVYAFDNNNSYDYQISLHCSSFHCLPYSTHLKLSDPNTQCKYTRSGTLCGQCQQGFSTVFGSTKCQQCLNIYLLLIIPIAIVGLMLVALLFLLNLTVTIGTINMFILYMNITSVYRTMLFPQDQHNVFTTFISFANFDLGITTCFYDGMDDYAKMWLQLVFPFYLICIATSLIIASRYSTKVQRLTARRALPVLATLFLLSYTKILLIVSSVMFSYSTITHLPSGHSTLVWAVDANVPLLSIRFIVLFVTCLVIFAIQVPFSIILLFTRTISRFHFINKFKPLLDAYQAPYKDKFYNWTGVQLVVRVVFIGISSLDKKISLTIGIMLLGATGYIQGYCNPLKSIAKNISELTFLFNLLIMFLFALYDNNNINNTVANVMITIAMVQFGLIITYHIVTFLCSKKIGITEKVQLSIRMLIIKFSNLCNRNHKINDDAYFLLDDVSNHIPEVDIRYRSL